MGTCQVPGEIKWSPVEKEKERASTPTSQFITGWSAKARRWDSCKKWLGLWFSYRCVTLTAGPIYIQGALIFVCRSPELLCVLLLCAEDDGARWWVPSTRGHMMTLSVSPIHTLQSLATGSLIISPPSNGLIDHIAPQQWTHWSHLSPRIMVPQSHTHSHIQKNPVLNTQGLEVSRKRWGIWV